MQQMQEGAEWKQMVKTETGTQEKPVWGAHRAHVAAHVRLNHDQLRYGMLYAARCHVTSCDVRQVFVWFEPSEGLYGTTYLAYSGRKDKHDAATVAIDGESTQHEHDRRAVVRE